MSERTDFLISYAERHLGRSLTEDEKEQIAQHTSRRGVIDLCSTFTTVKSSSRKKVKSSEKSGDKQKKENESGDGKTSS